MKEYNFQVNLGGMIDILANHLYSEESVFVRELLQNATDAITARLKQKDDFIPSVELELTNHTDAPSQLLISDNGIGLSEREVHRFLSIIGASSKKDELLKKREGFIGQFGIGLLSCFVAADTITLITKSATETQAVKWVGNKDGTYTVSHPDQAYTTGTRLYITARPEAERLFLADDLKDMIERYGNFLPYPIFLSNNNSAPVQINESSFPWERTFKTDIDRKKLLLKWAQTFFNEAFIDCIPVKAPASDTEGYAFISMRSYAFNQQQQHTVYLHRMLVSGKAVQVLPDWVFFAKCVVNSKNLRPTASRESFYEDEKLEQTREQLGESIINYLKALKETEPQLFTTIISNHETAIKLAAASNDGFLEQIYPFISFETNFGRQTLGALLQNGKPLKYVTDIDEFGKMAGVAYNQSLELVNAGYVYEASLMEKLQMLFPDYAIEKFDAAELMLELEELNLNEREQYFDFVAAAQDALLDFDCQAEIRKFLPRSLPAIYFKNDEMDYIRNIQKSKDVADELWSGILDHVSGDAAQLASAKLCFNYHNLTVRKAAAVQNKEHQRMIIKMLYVQALLLGRHSLQQKEMALLTNGLGFLIDQLTSNYA